MKFNATPYTIKPEAFVADVRSILVKPNDHRVLRMEDYTKRKALVVKAEGAREACDTVWMKYQNISHMKRTPDKGRSMMTGDLVHIVDEKNEESWWIVCSLGWAKTVCPGDECVEITEAKE